MSFVITAICFLIAAITTAYVIKEMGAAKSPSNLEKSSSLLERKLKLIETLREIELDRKTDKLSADDYEKIKLHTHHELSALLKELDSHASA